MYIIVMRVRIYNYMYIYINICMWKSKINKVKKI